MDSNDIRYEGLIYCDPAFPVSFHEDYMDMNRRFIYTHWHESIELLYFYEGQGHLICKSKTVPFKKGEILVIGSDVLHTLCADTPNCRYYCLKVEPHFLISNAIPQTDIYHTYATADAQSVRAIENIVSEFERGEMLYKSAVLGGILQLFTVLSRNHAATAVPPLSPISDNINRQHASIQSALSFIRENMSSPIPLEALCEHVGMSKYYFCRLFKAYTGMPPLQYINMLRCDHARHLITEGQMNIARAAFEVGIDNPSYFTKIYKRYIGVLPSEDALNGNKPDRSGAGIGVLKMLH